MVQIEDAEIRGHCRVLFTIEPIIEINSVTRRKIVRILDDTKSEIIQLLTR